MNRGTSGAKSIPPVQGRRAEDVALGFLEEEGLRLVARNYRCRGGEIDLIMDDGHCLVFVEVRYRRSARYGSALESVDVRKQSKLIRCASHYLSARRIDKAVRFDVIGIGLEAGKLAIQWVRDAFEA